MINISVSRIHGQWVAFAETLVRDARTQVLTIETGKAADGYIATCVDVLHDTPSGGYVQSIERVVMGPQSLLQTLPEGIAVVIHHLWVVAIYRHLGEPSKGIALDLIELTIQLVHLEIFSLIYEPLRAFRRKLRRAHAALRVIRHA